MIRRPYALSSARVIGIMFNWPNLIGWSNLVFRLLLGLGLVVIVQYRYGQSYVKPWLVYITLIASIQTTDGLISQYFLREILHASACCDPSRLKQCYSSQRGIYLALAVIFSGIAYFSLGREARALLAVLIGVFCVFKMYDSRARAFMDITAFQKLELAVNGGIALSLGLAFVLIRDYRWFPIFHLGGLIAGVCVKGWIAKDIYLRIPKDIIRATGSLQNVEGGLWQSMIMAFGGSLSVNLALLALQSLIGDKLTASYVLTYRIGALICEISSLPLIIRIPAITRQLVEGYRRNAMNLFRTTYRQALLICCLGFLTINIVSSFWNKWMPLGLHIETGIVLAIISAGWIFERTGTLMSQLFLSLKDYTATWIYIIYLVVLVVGIALSKQAESALSFAVLLMVSNILVATTVMHYWSRVRVE